jgi:hypothetical protein
MNNSTFTPTLSERIDRLLIGSSARPETLVVDCFNKEYVDDAATTGITTQRDKDLDMNNFQIKNVRAPSHPDDAVSKHYLDRRLEELFAFLKLNKLQHISSRGHIFNATGTRSVKTFFFNPGFIVPQNICIAAIGWATSPYKIKPEEVSDFRRYTAFAQLKLFFMVNNEVRTELSVEKDSEIGYTLKQFESPIFLNKGDNLMLVTDTALEDSSVNVAFYDRL